MSDDGPDGFIRSAEAAGWRVSYSDEGLAMKVEAPQATTMAATYFDPGPNDRRVDGVGGKIVFVLDDEVAPRRPGPNAPRLEAWPGAGAPRRGRFSLLASRARRLMRAMLWRLRRP